MSAPAQLSEPAIIRLIISFVRFPDSDEPTRICAGAAIWALLKLKNQPNASSRSADKAELLSALIHVVTTPYPSERLEKWNESVSFCSCDMSNQRLAVIPDHCPKSGFPSTDPRWEVSNRPLSQFILTAFEFLDPVIHDITPSHFTDKRIKKQKWPRKLDELVPRGLPCTVSAMAQWFQYTKSTYPLNFLVSLFPLIQPLAVMAMKQLPFILPVMFAFRIFTRTLTSSSLGTVPPLLMIGQAWHYGHFFNALWEYDSKYAKVVFPADVAKDMFQDCSAIHHTLLTVYSPIFDPGKLPVALYAQVRDAFARNMNVEDFPLEMRPLMDVDTNIQV